MTTMTVEDPRFWILDPVGHRQYENDHRTVKDGDTVETIFGPATVIISPPMPADLWVCDLCNDPILVAWGAEAFPVPMFGSHALCLNHFNEVVAEWKYDDPETGEISDILMGEWPLDVCNCRACVVQLFHWEPMLWFAYESLRDTRLRQEERDK